MPAHRWTLKVGLTAAGFLALLAAFVVIILTSGLAIAGVQPAAWALTAMMTAPFAIGVVLVATSLAALVETIAPLQPRAAYP